MKTIMTKTKKVFLGAKVSPHLKEKLCSRANAERRSISNMLEIFLEEGDNHLKTGAVK
jgi:hypothetical protein